METCVVKVKGKGIFETEFDNITPILEMADKGYRFIGYVPSKIVGYGSIASIDLIFEKKEENE